MLYEGRFFSFFFLISQTQLEILGCDVATKTRTSILDIL